MKKQIMSSEFETYNNSIKKTILNGDNEVLGLITDYTDEKLKYINDKTESHYFDIDYDGIISLKPEYRDANSSDECPYSVSDNGIGVAGSKINELPTRIVIPDVIDNTVVSGFQIGMFYGNNQIKEIVFPYSVTEIPSYFCSMAKYLEKIENTQHIEIIGEYAFRQTRIKKALFPNLKQFGKQSFAVCPMLYVVDIGNNITEFPEAVFTSDVKLSHIIGGDNITYVGKKALQCTTNLKNIYFLEHVEKFDDYSLLRTRCNYDWKSLKCTLGTYALPSQYSPTDYWSNCTFTPCEHKIPPVLFHQDNPLWANEQVGNTQNTYSLGCVSFTIINMLYGLEGIEFSKPQEFYELLEEIDPTLPNYDIRYMNNAIIVLNALAEEFGYEIIHHSKALGQAELQSLYDEIADGAYAYKTIMSGTNNVNGGHAVCVYGVNDIGELMIADSEGRLDYVDLYIGNTYSAPIQNLCSPQGDIVIVKKKK